MTRSRILLWEGFTNARDLGGLHTLDGRRTRRGALVRSDHPARLSAAGWSALTDYGVRTIISLTTHGLPEQHPDRAPRPPGITTLELAIEDVTDLEFRAKWASSDLWSTPLYYRDALALWPARHAAVISAVAHAAPGGVLFHCWRGVDRTGIIAILLLSALGVTREQILADYLLSLDPEREQMLERLGTTSQKVIEDTLDGLDIEAYLQAGGLSAEDLALLRSRLVA